MNELFKWVIGTINGKAPHLAWGIIIGALTYAGYVKCAEIISNQIALDAKFEMMSRQFDGMSKSFDQFTLNDMIEREGKKLDLEKMQTGLRMVHYRLDLCHGCPRRPYDGGN